MADWRAELGSILDKHGRTARAEQENAEFEEFLDRVALPALQDVAAELNSRPGCEARVRRTPGAVAVSVMVAGTEDLALRVIKHYGPDGILPSAEARVNRGAGFIAKYEGLVREQENGRIGDVTRDDVIGVFLRYFRLVREGGVQPDAK